MRAPRGTLDADLIVMFVKEAVAPATRKTMMPSVMSVTPLQRFAKRSVRFSCAVDHERTVFGAPGPAGGGGASAPTGGGSADSADMAGGERLPRTRAALAAARQVVNAKNCVPDCSGAELES